MVELRELGIKSTRLLEESFFDPFGKLAELTQESDVVPVYVNYGFAESMLPIKLVFSFDGDVIVTRFAAVLTREEVKKFYCGNKFK